MPQKVPAPARPAIARADLLLPALFGALGTIEIVASDLEPVAAALAANWVAAAVLVARRALPLAMPIAVAAVLAVPGLPAEDPAAWLLTLALACLTPGLHVPRSRALLGLASVLAASALQLWSSDDAVLVLTLAVGCWAVGAGLAAAFANGRELTAGRG